MSEVGDQEPTNLPDSRAEVDPRGYYIAAGFYPQLHLDRKSGFDHLADDFHEWPEMAECEASPVDTDIIEGRLHSFNSIEDLITNLKKHPPTS